MTQKICVKKDCSHKGNPQDINNFYRDISKLDNHHDECKDCMKATANKYNRKKAEARDAVFNMVFGLNRG